MKFLYANFATENGEIDLVSREDKTLVFVEVKTRSSELWASLAAAVNADKQRELIATARDYLRLLQNRDIPCRFDVAEVLLTDERANEVRHKPDAFSSRGHRN